MPEKVTSLTPEPPLKVRFGNFEIVSDAQGRPLSLGKGTFGRTYQARHSYLETIVALKIITERYVSDPTVRERFLIEARAVAKLSHPHIARLYDFGEADGILHYAMEYCGGGSLADQVARKGPLPLRYVFEIAQQITGALKCAHEAGFVHRDLKPSNIMLASAEGPLVAKLIDFGLVQPSLPGATRSLTASESADGARFLGTPLFASPEQLREEPMDVRTDLFSLGVTLWYLLVGGPPESGASAAIAASRLSSESYAARLPPNLAPAFRDVLARLLEKDRNKRFRSAAELSVALVQCGSALGFRITKENGEAKVLFDDLYRPEDESSSASEDLPPMELEQIDDSLASRFKIIARLNEDFSGLNYIAEEPEEAGSMKFLHVLHPMLLEDGEIMGVLRKHLAQLASLEESEVLRPERLIAFTDYTCIVVQKTGTNDLMSILRTERTVKLVEAAPLLESISDACDKLCAKGLPGVQLAPNRIFVAWPESNPGQEGGKHLLATAKPRLFPRFLAVSEAPELARLNEPEDVTSTMTTDMLSDPARADNMPEHFAMLLYRIVAGRNCPIAASLSAQAYVAIPGLSEQSNRTLSLAIAKQSSSSVCGEVLRDVLGAEGLVPRIPGHPTAGFTARSSSTMLSPLERPSNATASGSDVSSKTASGTSRVWKAPSISTNPPRQATPPPISTPPKVPFFSAPPPITPQTPVLDEPLKRDSVEAKAKAPSPSVAAPIPLVAPVSADRIEPILSINTPRQAAPPAITPQTPVLDEPLKRDSVEAKAKAPSPSVAAPIPLVAPVSADPTESTPLPSRPASKRSVELKEEKKKPELPAVKKIEKEQAPPAKPTAKAQTKKETIAPSQSKVSKPALEEPKPETTPTIAHQGRASAKVVGPAKPIDVASPTPSIAIAPLPPSIPRFGTKEFTPESVWKNPKVRAGGVMVGALLAVVVCYAAIPRRSHPVPKRTVVETTTHTQAPPVAPAPVTPAPSALTFSSATETAKAKAPAIAGRYALRLRNNSSNDAPETEREISIDASSNTGYVVEYGSDPALKVQIVDGHVTPTGGFEGRAGFASATAGAHPDEHLTATPQPDGQVQITFRGMDQARGDYALSGVAHPWTSDDQTNFSKLVAVHDSGSAPVAPPSRESEAAAQIGPNDGGPTGVKLQPAPTAGPQPPDSSNASKTGAGASHRKRSIASGEGGKPATTSHQTVNRPPQPRPQAPERVAVKPPARSNSTGDAHKSQAAFQGAPGN